MNVVVIGSGNVATHLAKALKAAGNSILQVWSRQPEHAATLAAAVDAEAISSLNQAKPDADLCILSVKDDAIAEISHTLLHFKGIIVHTSGALPIDVFHEYFRRYGVFYPLQTFSKTKEVDFRTIPLCIEASDPETYHTLFVLAQQLSTQVVPVDSEKRKILHLAAVFACNFPNYLYTIAADLLKKYDMSFEMLRPLILETALKVQHADPEDVQTGPAVRRDEQTLEWHEALLAGEARWKSIYHLLSEGIKNGKK